MGNRDHEDLIIINQFNRSHRVMISVVGFEMMVIHASRSGGLCNDSKLSNRKVVDSMHV